ncbi:unnamed protein product [Linum tenue]|uniref:Uncharacterized protein n=2 Tax=Linum tenue TaxID=586396 RepID=A0AAV0Q0D9_9ROSI|nr:unnamed protein product [Linum tenue]
MAEFQLCMESLDSLWFFNNVLSTSPVPTTNPIASPESEEEDSHELEEQSNQIAAVIQSSDEFELPVAPVVTEKGGGGSRVGEIVFESKPESPLERRKRMARRSRSKRKILLLELDLCFDDLNLLSPSRSYGIMVSQREDRSEIPSLNDSLAMKRHLKSWAQAVACTVK